MKFYGITLEEGTKIINASIDLGENFPSSPDDGELFFKTTAGIDKGLYVYFDSLGGWIQQTAVTDPRVLRKNADTGALVSGLNLGGQSITNVSTVNGLDLQTELDSKASSSHTHDAATFMSAGFMSPSDKSKLDTLDPAATANSSDSFLLSRSNHTGTQSFSTLTSLPTTLAGYNITLSSANVTAALGFTPYDATNPSSYTSNVGTVTSTSVTTAAGVSGSVLSATTTPAITITLDNITPTSVAASGAVTGSNLSGSNTGDDAVNTTYAADYRAANFVAGTQYLAPTGSAASLTSFPTLNQDSTGSAGTLTTGRTIGVSGDAEGTSGSFNGSANVTIPMTLSTVNSNVGQFLGTTVNAKGLVTAATNLSVTGDVTGTSVGATIVLTMSDTGVASATYGSTTTIPVFTVDSKGRLITVSNAAISPNAALPSQTGQVGKLLGTDGTTASWTSPPGATGVTGAVQYNNAGVSGGAANVSIGAGGDLLLKYDAVLPAATAADSLKVFNRSLGGRMMLSMVGPAGLDTALQPLIARNKIAFWNPIGNATTVPTTFGTSAPTALGTATTRTVTTTNVLTRMKRLGYVSAATVSALAGHWNPVAMTQYTVGTGVDLGGFHFIARWGVTDVLSGARMFIGMSSATVAPTNVEPNTLTNSVGVAQLSTSANLHIVCGGSAAQTAIDLGANFPASANNEAYDVSIFSAPNSTTTLGYTVTRIGTGQFTTGTITGVAGVAIPASTTLLGPRLWRCNNLNLFAVGLDIASWYIEVDQ